ncbi:MAG: DNA polymerase IV [Solirubrobacterales bacterium]
MKASASILHADLDAFYASVEQRDNPDLRGKPVIVGGGVVLACSYEAKALGIYTTMNGAQAKRTCPEAHVVPPRMEAYSEASKAVYEIFADTSPLVEGISIDEAFLDAGGLEHISGTPREVAEKLRREVLAKVGLNISVGVARTKFLAKVASGACKPDGLLVIEPEAEEAFLHPLPIEKLWGVGKVTTGKLNSMGIRTVGDIARCSESSLVAALGPASGRKLIDLANNRDPREVQPRQPRRSIGAQTAFPASSRTVAEIDTLAAGLVDRVTGRLRKGGKVCRTVSIGLRFDDFSRASRSQTLPGSTALTGTILAAVRSLLASARPMIEDKGLTLLSISLENLEVDDAVQMSFELEGDADGSAALDSALDDLRDRFGDGAVKRASQLESEEGVSVPVLPD